MPRLTLGIALGLILLGIGGYFGTGRQSPTALIPTFFGLPMAVLTFFALRTTTKARMHLMHVIVLLAVLGLFGSAAGLAGVFKLITGAEVERPAAAISKAIMALLCAVLVVFQHQVIHRRPPQPPTDRRSGQVIRTAAMIEKEMPAQLGS